MSERDGAITPSGAAALFTLALGAGAVTGFAASGLGALIDGTSLLAAWTALRSDALGLALLTLGGLGTALVVGHRAAFVDPEWRQDLGLHAIGAPSMALALAAGASLYLPLVSFARVLSERWSFFSPSPAEHVLLEHLLSIHDVSSAIVIPFAAVLVPAVVEELFFRGLLLPGLSLSRGPLVALVLSALFFGLIHLSALALIYATLAGLAFGMARFATGSVWAPIGMHGAFNALPVLIASGGLPSPPADHSSVFWVAGSAVLFAAAFTALIRRAGR